MTDLWQRLVAHWRAPNARSLPTDSTFRKDVPVETAFMRYFPAAIVAQAAWSKVANDKHNPGELVHWARGKSTDQGDTLLRHCLDLADAERRGDLASELEEATCAAWRANARLQLVCEKIGAPVAPAARVQADDATPAEVWHAWGIFWRGEDGRLRRSANLPDLYASHAAAQLDAVKYCEGSDGPGYEVLPVVP